MTFPPTTARPPAPETAGTADDLLCGLWVLTSPDAAQIGHCLTLSPGEELTLRRGVGKGAFADPWISQRHATLRVVGADDDLRVLVEDHGATNGVRHIRGPGSARELRLGTALRCGATLLLLDCGSTVDHAYGVVGASAALATVREEIATHAPQGYPVHVRGESGVGKEVVARALHSGSGRGGRFVSLNVAAVPDNLAEAELFGTVPGAFTGARQRNGLFVEAHGGTLLLDEIGELPGAIQAKLLRVLDDYAVRPLGSNDEQTVDARLVTATHRDLEQLLHGAAFREDLFWRLAGTTIQVPPLRERPLDIIPLFCHFYENRDAPELFALAQTETHIAWALCELLSALIAYDWPGNVRELERETERVAACIKTRHDARHQRPIPPPDKCLGVRVLQRKSWTPSAAQQPTPEVAAVGGEVERLRAAFNDRDSLLAELQERTGGNKRAFAKEAAKILGIKESTARRNIYRLLGQGKEGDEPEEQESSHELGASAVSPSGSDASGA